MKKIIIALMPVLIACTAFVSKPGTSRSQIPASDTTPVQMKQYWLVLLQKGANRGQDSATASQIQQGHMANIRRLAREGVLLMAGPMGDDTNLVGIFIMDAKDSTTCAGYVKTDPAVIAGRLRFELHPWWTAKGTYEFK